MDFSALFAALLDTFLNFFLTLVLDGLFGFLADLLFGGSSSGLI